MIKLTIVVFVRKAKIAMKNSDFIKLVIHCKDCIHRGTWRCPMNYYNPDIEDYYDMTEDEMFCSEGEKNNE